MAEDILGQLEPYFCCNISVKDKDKIIELHNRFCKDFFIDKVVIGGVTLKVKQQLYSNSHNDILPEWFNGLYEKFVHIITRDAKENKYKTARSIRKFCPERAVRIHWIKPILENASDKRITHFKHIEYNGREREYFWYRNKGYMAVVEYINPGFALITGFCVDETNHAYFMRKLQNKA